jgi:hypothetical protein
MSLRDHQINYAAITTSPYPAGSVLDKQYQSGFQNPDSDAKTTAKAKGQQARRDSGL